MANYRYLIGLLFLLLLLTSCQAPSQPSMSDQKVIKINSNELTVELATTAEEIVKGLSGRASLCQDCGMLFEFPDYQIRNFWMKDMQFSLDIIWIKDNQIVGIAGAVPVFSSPGTIGRAISPVKVNKVLEVGSGWAEQHNVKPGDRVEN